MIVVDTSAIFAVLYDEDQGPACAVALAANTRLLISAGTLAEAYVVAARSGFTTALESFLSRVTLEVVPVDAEAAASVGRGYARYGRGLHAASLNFGDGFAYALAKERNCPLLFIGNDFSLTDLASALQ
jgi:ribonuclease VapC